MSWRVCALVLASCAASAPAPRPSPPAAAVAPPDAAPPPPTIDAPDPPSALAACTDYDPSDPACNGDRSPTAPTADWKCPSGAPLDIENPACRARMPCPKPPDLRVRACRPTCVGASCGPILGRVLGSQPLADGGQILWISAGARAGVTLAWHAELLDGDSDRALPGAPLEIVSVTRNVTTVRLRAKGLVAPPRARLSPP